VHFDRVIYQPMPDSAVLVANLRTGNIDIAERVLPTDVAEVKKDPKLRIVTSPALGYEGITFNLGNGDRSKAAIDQNPLLRQALDAAIDRQALVEVVFNGMYQPTAQAVPPSSPFYAPGMDPPSRDIDRAIALVKQSGVKTPISVSMNVPNTPDRMQLAEVIQSMVRDAGFDLKLNLFEFASSLSAASQGNFESYLIGWSGRADADGNLYVFLHTGAGQNDGRYSSSIVDNALDTARTLTDPAARRAEYAKLMEQEHKDLPIIYLFHPVNVVALSARLSGFRPIPDGMIRLQGISVAR
jgi:peptide/nickel transport system substrate-binding protein